MDVFQQRLNIDLLSADNIRVPGRGIVDAGAIPI